MIVITSALFSLGCMSIARGDDVAVVNYGKLGTYWVLKSDAKPPDMPFSEVKGRMDSGAVGCVNVGFLIDSNGTPKGFHLLKAAIDDKARRRQNRGELIGLGSTYVMLSFKYEPARENDRKQSVFTSYAHVFIAQSIAKTLDEDQKKRLVAKLLPACDIPDLPGWVAAHGVREPEIVTAPNADDVVASLKAQQ
jgi:hypothetical protein